MLPFSFSSSFSSFFSSFLLLSLSSFLPPPCFASSPFSFSPLLLLLPHASFLLLRIRALIYCNDIFRRYERILPEEFSDHVGAERALASAAMQLPRAEGIRAPLAFEDRKRIPPEEIYM